MKIILRLLTLFLFVVSIGIAHAAEKRVALVIGNGAYADAPLRNPVNDAADISSALKQLGFDVIHEENTGRKQLRSSIRQFQQKLRNSAVGLFYYAGHGMQVAGRNYLIPVDADIKQEFEVPDEAIEGDSVLRAMQSAGNALNIVILDACRNNPFARSFRSSSRGLARMTAPTGSIVAYATAPGSVAADGEGRNGVYTKHLLKAMNSPDLSIEQVFKRVRIGVKRDTGGGQVPWEESSLEGNFYFAGQKVEPPGASQQVASTTVPGLASMEGEIVFWQSLQGSKECSDYEAYLASYPSGRFSNLAKARRTRFCVEAIPAAPEVEVAGGMDVRDLLEECAAHLEANRLTTGKGGNALDCYTDALQINPGNQTALDGITAIEDKYIGWAEREIKRRNAKRAERFLASLQTVNTDREEVGELEEVIAGLKKELAQQIPVQSHRTHFPYPRDAEVFDVVRV